MAKSKSTSSNVVALTKCDPNKELYNAVNKLADIRAELVVASEVLSDSAFSGSNAITDDRDCCAVLMLSNGVKKLSELQAELDQISAELAQPKAIKELKAVGHV